MSDWLSVDSPGAARHQYTRKLSAWPQQSTILLAVLAVIVASFRSLLPSLIAYVVLLLGGSGLILADRVRQVVRSRDPDCRWIPVDERWKRASLLVMMAGCLANGFVVAWVVATQ